MYKIFPSSRFKKDLKIALKRGYDVSLLDNVVSALADGEQLDEQYYDHPLKGSYSGCHECHILPDWLLIYRLDGDELILYLTRTGSHSDLF